MTTKFQTINEIYFHCCLLQTYWTMQERKPETALEVLQSCNKTHFPNIHKVLQIVCVFPVTSCESERSFSSLHRLENYMRTTMSEDRLIGLMLMLVHWDVDIDLDKLVQTFAAEQPGKMLLCNVLSDDWNVILKKDDKLAMPKIYLTDS